MWMSLVEMNVWMRGRSESLTAFQAASTSCAFARASPQMTGPCTSRAMACTASKSPGEEIGKPASITSTPSRASWCAISSFSCLFSEIPGDCSPSRRVVSKIFTRSFSMRSMSLPVHFVGLPVLPRIAAVRRPPRAIHPPKGRRRESRRPARNDTPQSVHGRRACGASPGHSPGKSTHLTRTRASARPCRRCCARARSGVRRRRRPGGTPRRPRGECCLRRSSCGAGRSARRATAWRPRA